MHIRREIYKISVEYLFLNESQFLVVYSQQLQKFG